MRGDKQTSDMNQDSPSQDTVEAQRAAALEQTRLRVEEATQRRAEEKRIEDERRGRERGVFAPDSTPGFWFDILMGDRIMVALALLAIGIVGSSLLWLAEALRWPIFQLFRSLDLATGAHAMPSVPFLMWTLWGAIFGGCLGYWLVAPVYGDRENRSFVLLLPVLAMAITAAIIWAFVR
jgi:hypothetical protein